MKNVKMLAAVIGLGITSFAVAGSGSTEPAAVVNQVKSEYQSLAYVSQLPESEKDAYLATRFSDWKTIPAWGKDAMVFLLRNHCVEPDGDRVAGQQYNVQQPLTTIRAGNTDMTKRVEMYKLLAQFAGRIATGECVPGAFSSINELKAAQDVLRLADSGLSGELKELKDKLAALEKRPDGDQVARDALAALREDYLSLANMRFDLADKFSGVNVKIGNLADELMKQRGEIDALKALAPLKGDAGQVGAQGPQGPAGSKGDTGLAGANGTNGAGSTGPQGPAGTPGQTGAQGPKGDKSETGAAGVNGTNGTAGSTGATGPAGKDGRDGLNGQNGKDGQTVTAAVPAAAPITNTNTNTNTAMAKVVVNVYNGAVATTSPDGKTVDVRMPTVVAPSVSPVKPVFVCNGDSRVLSTVQVCISPVEICFYLLDGTPVTVLRYEASNGGYVYYLANGAQVLATRAQGGISVQQIR